MHPWSFPEKNRRSPECFLKSVQTPTPTVTSFPPGFNGLTMKGDPGGRSGVPPHPTVLYLAVSEGDAELARILLAYRANPDIGGGSDTRIGKLIHSELPQAGPNATPLQVACAARQVNIVQLLLENDADANIEGESRPRHLQLSNLWQAGPDGTALQLAGPMGLVEIVKLILESNADPNIKSETPQLFFEVKTNLVSPRRPAWDRTPSSLM
jgi:hypothetical protein